MAVFATTTLLLSLLSGAVAQAPSASAAPAAPVVTDAIRPGLPQTALATGPGGYVIP